MSSPTRHPLALSMSQIIASDAPLSSPISDSGSNWDPQPLYSPNGIDTFALNYPHYAHPPSPPYSDGSNGTDSPINPMLKMRMSPDYSLDQDQQLCVPTHQVFDLPPTPPSPMPPTPPSPAQSSDGPCVPRLSIDGSGQAMKRPSTPMSGICKKPRASGERISTKDFVPPDVTGLSKREARLVKNRAAAFLSRQRKREEFENMEVRVAELEQENARLQAIAQNSASHVEDNSHELLSEIDQLRARLAVAEQRERELNSALSRRAPAVKVETAEPRLPPTSPTRATFAQTSHKAERTSASLSLLVLLCALPSIFSMTTQSHPTLPVSGSFPLSGLPTNPLASSKFDFSAYLPNEYDWRMPSNSMDLDMDSNRHASSSRKLQFVDADADALGLGGLDITFDAEPAQNGKIRVRIHPSSSSASSSSSSTSSSSAPSQFSNFDDLMSSWNPSSAPAPSLDAFGSQFAGTMPPSSHMLPPQTDPDPFLGVGMSSADFGFGVDPNMLMGHIPAADPSSSAKRRVRIALKSMPTAGGGGGEWEVELC
ncbi:hypothetical protein DENSPDRAFT_774772 [Dentipellis sp. KUC8613]|nr:hypothetical protein DENSPDRAFT_774772 [Dentipellis sp. KUC8613]